MTYAATIPLEDIQDIQLYAGRHRNTKAGMQQVLKKTGGDIVLPGPIFLRNLKPCTHLKADGKVLCAPSYNAQALAWTEPEDFEVCWVPTADKANWMECVHAIINGKKVSPMNYGKDMGYACNRVATGTKQGRLGYYATEDNLTPERLRDRLYQAGWDNAIMHDGGGSACIGFKDGTGFAGDGRTIPFWLVITLKKKDNEPKGEKPMVEINAYSLKKDGGKQLAKNFKLSEFACKDGSDVVFVAQKLPMVLQYIRMRAGKAVTINSAYRTPAYNKKVGGVEQSQHLYGTAADISVKGVSPATVAAYAREIMPDWGGVGTYASQGFTHIDVRDTKADWKG